MLKILFIESSSGFSGSANALANIVNHFDNEIFHPIIALKNYGTLVKNI